MTVVYFVVGFLTLFFTFFQVWKKNKKKSNPEGLMANLLKELNQSDRYDSDGFSGETRVKILEVEESIHHLIDEMLKDRMKYDSSTWREKSEIVLREAAELKNLIRQSVQKWEQVEQTASELTNFTENFFKERQFYPKNLTIIALDLQNKQHVIKDAKRTNPLSSTDDVASFLDNYQKEFDSFVSMHKKVTETFGGVRDPSRQQLKNDCYFALQRGDYKLCEKLLKQ